MEHASLTFETYRWILETILLKHTHTLKLALGGIELASEMTGNEMETRQLGMNKTLGRALTEAGWDGLGQNLS